MVHDALAKRGGTNGSDAPLVDCFTPWKREETGWNGYGWSG
jgi:hypothetical protein